MIRNTKLAQVLVFPNPIDVVLPNNYIYTTIVREFPETIFEFVNNPSLDNQLIRLSDTVYTMDQT